MDQSGSRAKCHAGASRFQRKRHCGCLWQRCLLAPVLGLCQAFCASDDACERAQHVWNQGTDHPRLLGHDRIRGTKVVWTCRRKAAPRVVGRITQHKEQLHAGRQEHAGTALDERSAHPLALKLGKYSQRCEDGSPNSAGSACKNHSGEQDVPDWLVGQQRKQRQAWLSRGVVEQRRHQRRLIVARKGCTYNAQRGIGVSCACFNDSHDARGLRQTLRTRRL